MAVKMHQEAPFPDDLADLVARLRYRPGWTFTLADQVRDIDPATKKVLTRGLTLDIITNGYDAYHPERGEHYRVHHYRIVPAATYNRQSWQRWLLEQCLAVEQHEACEFFALTCDVCGGSGHTTASEHGAIGNCPECKGEPNVLVHPFAPNHGPGADPYRIVEYETDEARRTRFTGEIVR